MRGKPIDTDGTLDSASLRALMARLHVIGGRRLSALGFLLGAWALLLALRGAVASARARGRCAPARSACCGRRSRCCVPAALEPSAAVEYVDDRARLPGARRAHATALVPWPRALLAPALVGDRSRSRVDALAGTQLLMRSLLGPNPILGARFYGIGNELKSGLAVLVLAAVAAALYPAVRGRRAAAAMAGAGVVLAVVEGSARIGAGVGGVILVSFGFAVASDHAAPGALTRRRALLVLVSPVAGLVALAALDLADRARRRALHRQRPARALAGDLRDIIVRRYGAAWGELHNHAMPVATALALLAARCRRAPARAPARARRRRPRLAGRARRRSRRGRRRRARRGLRPGAARGRRVRAGLRSQLSVGTAARWRRLGTAASARASDGALCVETRDRLDRERSVNRFKVA